MMKAIIPLLLLTCAILPTRAEDLTLTAAELFRWSASDKLRLSADGKSLEMMRGLLIENDGAAAGFSYRPNEESLSDGTVAIKWLTIPETDVRSLEGAKASLLVGHTGQKLQIEINGRSVALGEPQKAGNYWKRYAIPIEVLQIGKNEVRLTGDGKLWIARADDRFISPKEQPPQQSARQKPGAEPQPKLGPREDIAGEYYVRLYLDGYFQQANLTTPIFDAALLRSAGIAPPAAGLKRLRIQLEGTWGGDGLPAIFVLARSKPSALYSDVYFGGNGDELDYEVSADRYPQLHLFLRSRNAGHTPRLTGAKIDAQIDAAVSWGAKIKILGAANQPLAGRPDSVTEFKFEELGHPKLAQFRRDYHLEEVVKGCKTDLERMEKLAVWTSQQWTKGHLKDIYPKWDACEILKKHADGTPVGGFCQQYNIVFLQACEAFGMPGRCVSIGAGDHGVKIRSGHEVVEIWSNELSKWVYVDGQAAWYFVDKETREPLNLLELRERQLAALLDKPLRAESKRPVEVVVLAKSPYEWKGLTEWPAFTELRMIPHTQFLDGELPLPLNQGMRGWFWTGHRVWTDDLYPASVLYSDRVTNANDWNFPINQTQIWLQQNTKVGELDVRCEHNMPSFAKYELQFDDQPPRFEHKAEFQWPLHPGENRLQVRAVNKLGLKGPASWYKVEFK